jgi:ATP-dependent DNA helicase RecQ
MNPVALDLLTDATAGLKRHFGLDAFRPGQAEVVSSVLSGRNTVVVMPTGAGKSLCYQLPATLLSGVTLVISPLISLMKDQVDALTARGISATFINSTLTDAERADRQRRLREGAYKLVYVAPERFRSEAFVSSLVEAKVEVLAIDEAHCISQWGHDFRPDYSQLGQIRKRLRPPRTVALTATATPEVRDDIVKVLLMKDPQVFVAGFDRPNLFLEVVTVSGDADKRAACLQLAGEGSGVVYCSTRKQAEGLHDALKKKKVKAVLYHAGMDDDDRKRAQDDFMATAGSVAIATNAFGMGIDKSDIRFVAHAAIPRAVEAYYQEIGRAGRDGQSAHVALLFNHADVFTQQRLIESSHPPETLFADVWNALAGVESFSRGVQTLAAQVGANEFEVSAVLKQLERAGKLNRGGRGEGRWEIKVATGANPLGPKSPEARAVLADLIGSFGTGTSTSTELYAICRRTGLDDERVRHALALLERAGTVELKKPFAGRAISCVTRVPFDELGLDLGRVRALERQALLLLKRMTDYAYNKRCRRAFLLRYFGETQAASNCGNCDVCVSARLKVDAAAVAAAAPRPAAAPEHYSVLASEELRRFRRELSRDLGIAPYLIFSDATMYALAAALPTCETEFLRVRGAGDATWERFGPKIVEICLMARAAGHEPQAVVAAVRRRRR